MSDRSDAGEIRKSPSVRWSIRYAFEGVAHALYTERNLRIHFAVSMLGCIFCILIHPAVWMVALGLYVSAMVIAFELLNTAIENVTDIVTDGRRHPFAKVAKDAAAGAVLTLSVGALFVGVYLAASTFPWRVRPLTLINWQGTALCLAAMMLLGYTSLYTWLRYRKPS